MKVTAWHKRAFVAVIAAISGTLLMASPASAGTWRNSISNSYGYVDAYISHGASSNTGCSYAKVNGTYRGVLEDRNADAYGVVAYLQYTDCATGQIKQMEVGKVGTGKTNLSLTSVYNAKLPRLLLCAWTTGGGSFIDCAT
ncbi:hypothetical protein ACIO1C_20590 [Streptomyces sp. NPDC087420]|uniref:hypothetical protein n=1 Tax=Streptomyces sp. NPDC087420 TaxID=3365785 RepID=UPI0038338FAD